MNVISDFGMHICTHTQRPLPLRSSARQSVSMLLFRYMIVRFVSSVKARARVGIRQDME